MNFLKEKKDQEEYWGNNQKINCPDEKKDQEEYKGNNS